MAVSDRMWNVLHEGATPFPLTINHNLGKLSGTSSLSPPLAHHICYSLSQKDSVKPHRRECPPNNKWA